MSIVAWLKRLTRRRLDDEDFKQEIRAHLAIATEEKMADGADRQTAHYAALKEFGNVTLTTEEARRVWTPLWLDALHDLVSDVRYAIRGLAKNPAFSLTVVGVLALGIGLNAAVFTMAKGLGLSPLAGVEGSARLRVIFAETSAGRPLGVSYPDYQYLRDHDQAFSGLFGSTFATVGLGRGRSARSGPSSSPGTTFRSSAFVPNVAAPSYRLTRSLPAAIRSSSSAMVCGDATSAPIRTLSARRLRSITTR